MDQLMQNCVALVDKLAKIRAAKIASDDTDLLDYADAHPCAFIDAVDRWNQLGQTDHTPLREVLEGMYESDS